MTSLPFRCAAGACSQIIRIFDSILSPKLADFDVEIRPLAAHIAQATLRVRLVLLMFSVLVLQHSSRWSDEIDPQSNGRRDGPDGLMNGLVEGVTAPTAVNLHLHVSRVDELQDRSIALHDVIIKRFVLP